MKKAWWLVAGFAVVAIVVGLLLAFVPQAQSSSAGEVVAAYDAPLHGDDPDFPAATTMRLDPASVRYVGEADGRAFWIARDADAQFCFVVAIETSELSGGSCARLEVLQESGLMIGVEGFGDSIVAHLVPDDVDIDAAPEPWTIVGENVLVADADELADGETLILPRQNRPDLVLRH